MEIVHLKSRPLLPLSENYVPHIERRFPRSIEKKNRHPDPQNPLLIE
ncbi:hypothetical protein LEP1GSC061_1250 [Leptospira wolffii serovar Khorat str. Khorat-H2]|nr:hypothetical protein LEP1GSC061_1250 [Leptospira wolffii serovar Khorat str. Khorat-H2]